ncbi:hypothetical protein WJX77_003167 [Trebouxia sp. C0004]
MHEGLEDWVAAVKSRSSEELPAFERVNGYLALLQWELLATFLHDIPHHFFKHRTSPVFLDLPVFQNAVFTDWLLGDFRHQILQLQLKADRTTSTLADTQSILEDVFSRITAQAYRQHVQQAAARVAEEEASTCNVHHAGDLGVVTMPLGGNLTLEKLWLAWEPKEQGRGCEGLRIYKAESPDLYPSDQARRHQMRWLRQGDGNRFDQFRQVFLTMDRLVRKKNSSNRKRDATTIISSWRRSPFSSPQCPINTVAGLAVALKAVCQWRQADLWRFSKLFTEQKLRDSHSPDGLWLSVGGHKRNRSQGKKCQEATEIMPKNSSNFVFLTILRPKRTGLSFVVYVSPKGNVAHGPRIKASNKYGDKMAKKWVRVNKEELLKIWEDDIDAFDADLQQV